MMNKLCFLTLLFFYFSSSSFSQVLDDPLESYGELPSYLNLESETLSTNRKSINPDKVDFSSELISLFNNGSILFGDTLSEYAKGIAANLVTENGLKTDFDLYVYKSREYNAFVTADGVICISLGLLAKASSEGEVAFVLAHEIGHHILKHSLGRRELIQKIAKDRSLEKLSPNEAYQKYESLTGTILEYSRSQELEADSIGLILYLNAGYDFEYSKSSLAKTMNKWNLGFEHHFDLGALLNCDISFELDSSNLLPTAETPSLSPDSSVAYESNELASTHPSLEKRIKRLNYLYEKLEKSSINYSSTEYAKIKTIATNELFFICCREADYVAALYLYGQLSIEKVNKIGYADPIVAQLVHNIHFDYKNKVFLSIDDFYSTYNVAIRDYSFLRFFFQISNFFKQPEEQRLLILGEYIIDSYLAKSEDPVLQNVCLNLMNDFSSVSAETSEKVLGNSNDLKSRDSLTYYDKALALTGKVKNLKVLEREEQSFTFRSYTTFDNYNYIKEPRDNQEPRKLFFINPDLKYLRRSETRIYSNINLAKRVENNLEKSYRESFKQAKMDVVGDIMGTSQSLEGYKTIALFSSLLKEKLCGDSDKIIPFFHNYLKGVDTQISHIVLPRYYVLEYQKSTKGMPIEALLSPQYIKEDLPHQTMIELVLVYNVEQMQFSYIQFEQTFRKPRLNYLRSIIYKTCYDIKNNI